MKNIYIPFIISITFVSLFFIFFEDIEVYFSSWMADAKYNTQGFSWISFFILSSDIVLPVPSSIVMYTNGIVLGFIEGTLLSMVSVVVSSTIGYYLGRFTSKIRDDKQKEKAEAILQKYGSIGIILTRGIPILSESICFTAGYNRLDVKFFSIVNVIGYLPVCMLYAYFGSIGQSTNMFLLSFGISLLVSFILWLVGHKMIAQYFNKNAV